MFHWTARTLLWALLIFPGIGRAEAVAPADAKIRIAGTGGALGTLQIVADAFKKIPPYATVVLIPSLGSSGGTKALLAGAIDLAVTGQPLNAAERRQGAIQIDYARTPLVFANAASTRVSAITQRELVSIYSGDLTSWPDGRALRLILRPHEESDTVSAKSLSPAMHRAIDAAHARAGMIMEATDQDNARSLQSVPGALGTISLAQITSEKLALQPLTLDGVIPSLQTLDDGRYRYFETYSFVSTTAASPLVRQFIAFVQSPAAQQILQKNGQSPVRAQ